MIYLGADHAGYKLKENLKKYLDDQKIKYQDLGNLKSEPGDDFPEYGYKVAKAVAKNSKNKGILICGTSYGMCIIANKVKGIRALPVKTEQDACDIRKHNDANIICLPGWGISIAKTKKIINKFLNTKFEAIPRRKRRLKQIKTIENKEFK